MRIKKLVLTNLRALTHAEFDFHDGMNLLVGVNGVGKTTVLDALRICLSRTIPEITASTAQKEPFEVSDITIGAKMLQVSCDFESVNGDFNFLLTKNKENVIPEAEEGNPRKQVIEVGDAEQFTPPLSTIFRESKKAVMQPLAIYFSTRRSLFTEKEITRAAKGQAAAYSDALSFARESNLRVLAEWFKAQQALGEELPIANRHVAVLRDTIKVFLPEFDNLYTADDEKGIPSFFIEKNGVALNVRHQLSDGERGILALVMELSKRLSQANPELDNPVKDGIAVVLIDEIDLHLHPKWQRTIVENLQKTFPSCQFIATTHSPQIIGEVAPKHITIIDNGTHNPIISFGMDSSSILEEILDVAPRNKQISELLNKLYRFIDEENFEAARKLLEDLKPILGSDNQEVRRSETMIQFLEDDITDETDK